MKKLLLIALVLAVLSAGCSTRKVIRHEFAYTDYNRFVSATLMALNERNFSVESVDPALGLIKAVDYSAFYTKFVLGLYIIVPGFYTETDHPRASIVIQKGQEKMLLTANIATNTGMETSFDNIVEGIDFWYMMHEKSRNLPKKTEDRPKESAKKTQGINPAVEWIALDEMSVTNGDNFGWNNVFITLVYLEKDVFREYIKAVPNIEQGRTISLRKDEFRDANGNKLKNTEKPDRVSIKCKTMKGDFQWSAK